jgi:hypothetical protein
MSTFHSPWRMRLRCLRCPSSFYAFCTPIDALPYYFEQIPSPDPALSAVTDSRASSRINLHTLSSFLSLLSRPFAPPSVALSRLVSSCLSLQLLVLALLHTCPRRASLHHQQDHRGGAKRYPPPDAVELSAHRCLARSCSLQSVANFSLLPSCILPILFSLCHPHQKSKSSSLQPECASSALAEHTRLTSTISA